MKKTLLFLAALLSAPTFAQQFTYSGTSLISNTIPLNSSASQNLRQSIYHPANFPTAPSGNITAIYLLSDTDIVPNLTNLTIKMGYTTNDTFPNSTFITGLQTVYTGAYNQPLEPGQYMKITLQTPFAYDNTKNFILEISQGGFTKGVTIMQASVGLNNRTVFGASTNSSGTLQHRLATLKLDITTALDVSETHMMKNISVYPNPTSDILYISEVAESSPFEIFDTSGRTITKGLIKNKQVNVSNLLKGNYIISVKDKGREVLNTKFIKD